MYRAPEQARLHSLIINDMLSAPQAGAYPAALLPDASADVDAETPSDTGLASVRAFGSDFAILDSSDLMD